MPCPNEPCAPSTYCNFQEKKVQCDKKIQPKNLIEAWKMVMRKWVHLDSTQNLWRHKAAIRGAMNDSQRQKLYFENKLDNGFSFYEVLTEEKLPACSTIAFFQNYPSILTSTIYSLQLLSLFFKFMLLSLCTPCIVCFS